jgi:hypothetical protein
MKRVLPMLAILFCGFAFAEETTVFTAPKVYPVERYETGWSKNPFTLKTAPVVVENASFAKDLAIAGISGDTANPTVTVVNIKTHERFRLKLGEPGANGMLLSDVKRAASRKDSVVEVTLGAETSKIHYDNSYLKQVAATSTAKAAPPGSPQALQQLRQTPVQPGMPRPQIPGQPPQTLRLPTPSQQPAGGGFTASNGAAAVPPAPQGSVPAFAFNQGSAQGAAVGTAVSPAPQDIVPASALNQGSTQGGAVGTAVPTLTVNTSGGMNLSVSSGAPTGSQGVTNPPQVSQVASAAPVPVRRRMITPVNNVPPVQQ